MGSRWQWGGVGRTKERAMMVLRPAAMVEGCWGEGDLRCGGGHAPDQDVVDEVVGARMLRTIGRCSGKA